MGNVSELGEWNVQRAIPLSADRFTQSRPRWIGRVKGLRPGQVMEYKFVKTREAANGGTEVEWEADPNHTLTVPAGCETEVVVSGRWQTREA